MLIPRYVIHIKAPLQNNFSHIHLGLIELQPFNCRHFIPILEIWGALLFIQTYPNFICCTRYNFKAGYPMKNKNNTNMSPQKSLRGANRPRYWVTCKSGQSEHCSGYCVQENSSEIISNFCTFVIFVRHERPRGATIEIDSITWITRDIVTLLLFHNCVYKRLKGGIRK